MVFRLSQKDFMIKYVMLRDESLKSHIHIFGLRKPTLNSE